MILETLLVAFSIADTPDPLACPRTHLMPGYPDNAVVIVVDGDVYADEGGRSKLRELDFLEAGQPMMEMRCWNPETDELPAEHGVQLLLFISNEHRDEAEAAALGVAQLVRAYAVEHGALPTSLDALGPAAQGFELEALEQGWKVTRRDARPLMCSAFQPVGTESRVVQCEMNYDQIRKNLRAVTGPPLARRCPARDAARDPDWSYRATIECPANIPEAHQP